MDIIDSHSDGATSPVVSALLPVGHVEIECIAHLPSHACAAANSEAVCCCICMCLYTCKMIYTFNVVGVYGPTHR